MSVSITTTKQICIYYNNKAAQNRHEKEKGMKPSFENFLESPEGIRMLAEESFIFDCLEELCKWMEDKGISRDGLIEKLRKTKFAITKRELKEVFDVGNITLKQLAAFVHALGGTPRFSIEPQANKEKKT